VAGTPLSDGPLMQALCVGGLTHERLEKLPRS
jgi:hypothetical protein